MTIRSNATDIARRPIVGRGSTHHQTIRVGVTSQPTSNNTATTYYTTAAATDSTLVRGTGASLGNVACRGTVSLQDLS